MGIIKRILKKIKEIEWIFDFHIAYHLYNANKSKGYHQYMKDKWGKRYMDTNPPEENNK